MRASALVIRPMEPAEKGEVRGIMRRCFPLLMRPFFSLGGVVLVAQHREDLLGAVVMNRCLCAGGAMTGIISWIFTAPEARGMGVGQALIDRALDHLERQGCDEILAVIEGTNTASSGLFSSRGFSLLSFGQQILRYRWQLPRVWYAAFHVIDIGHFLWRRPASVADSSPALQWLAGLLINTAGVLLALRGGMQPMVLFALALLFGLREGAMRVVGGRSSLGLRHRMWETGLLLSVGIAFLFGGILPVPGSVYPADDRWRYRESLSALGPVALAGMVPALALTLWAFYLGPGGAGSVGQYLLMLGRRLIIFDTLLPFFPFNGYNGRRVYDWSPWTWLAAALSAMTVLLLTAN